MENKKAQTFSTGTVFAGFLAIVFILFLIFGGASTLVSITGVLSQIPAWVWVLLIILFVFWRWTK
jgi:hypothetical protein